MFPWHEHTVAFLALLALGGGCAMFVCSRGRLRRWVHVAVFLAALFWPWPIAFILGLDSYVILAALYLSAGTVLALALGAVWGLACRRLEANPARLAAAILPALAGAAFVLERQRIPDAPCAERAVFRIGDQTLALPIAMGARSVLTEGAPPQDWQGVYSAWPGAKPEVRALCDATSGGRDVLHVSHLWFSTSVLRKQNQADCESGEVPEHLEGYCAAMARTRLAVVQFYARPDGLPYPSLSHFNIESVVDALNSGEMTGYRCGSAMGDAKQRYCTLWQPVSPQVLAVSTAVLGPPSINEDPVGDAAAVLETLIASFRPVSHP